MRSMLRRVFCNVGAYVSCRGYDGILAKGARQARNQGGTADHCMHSSLTDSIFCQGRFFIPSAEHTHHF